MKKTKCIDLTGQLFGMLTVVEYAGLDKWHNARWKCLCECGKETIVVSMSLKKGHTKSCGCFRDNRMKTHGLRDHLAYSSWDDAKSRTTNPKDKAWDNYGGRGIKMCQEWEDSFEVFWLDMGPSWKEGLTLDRIDVNGNYCKENCRWTTRTVQSHNRRKAGDCSSQYIGVSFDKKRGKYISVISVEHKHNHLGRFINEIDAAIAYDNASEQIYGDRPNGTSRHTNDLVEAIKEANEAEAL